MPAGIGTTFASDEVPSKRLLELTYGSDGFLVDEFQARVDFRRTRQGPGDLPQEQLQDRQEALQVGLLVDREFDVAFVEQFLGFFGQVEAAGLDAFGGEPELLHHARQFRGVAAVDGVHALRGRMAGPVGFDRGFLARFQGAGHDRGDVDRRARFLDRFHSSFEARLQVRRARIGGEDDHVARAHGGDDPLAHQFAGQFQVLADVGQALVGGRGGVGVVGDDRDARLQRVFDRHVERGLADQRHRDPAWRRMRRRCLWR